MSLSEENHFYPNEFFSESIEKENQEKTKIVIKKHKSQDNFISQLINGSQNNNETPPIFRDWIKVSDLRNREYQKTFKNSQENFIKNTRVLFMRYELFHLCLAELLYESKGKPKVNSFILGQISKIHEQLFRVGLKNLASVFENQKYTENIHNKNKATWRETNKIFETYQGNLLNFKHETSKFDGHKEKKLLHEKEVQVYPVMEKMSKIFKKIDLIRITILKCKDKSEIKKLEKKMDRLFTMISKIEIKNK